MLRCCEQRWTLVASRFAGLRDGQAAKLAIRPNYPRLADEGDGPPSKFRRFHQLNEQAIAA